MRPRDLKTEQKTRSVATPIDEREAEILRSRLPEVGLFAGLHPTALAWLVGRLTCLEFGAGDAVFTEGEVPRDMFVLLEGEAEVTKKNASGSNVRLAVLGPNDTFGEMSLIDVQARSATVRALGPCRVLRMTCEDLDGLYRHDIRAYSMMTLNIARELSRRLRVTDGLLAQVAAQLPQGALPRRRSA